MRPSAGPLVLALAMALTAGVPAIALAHVTLRASEPGGGETVKAPGRLVLLFDGPVDRSTSWVLLVGPRQTKIILGYPRPGGSPESLEYGLPLLMPGAWEVRWSVVASDGHRVEGVVKLTVSGP